MKVRVPVPSHDTFLNIVVVVTHSYFFVALRVLQKKVNFSLHLCFFFLVYGKNVAAVVEQPLEEEKMHPGKNTVTFEARELKSLFMRLV